MDKKSQSMPEPSENDFVRFELLSAYLDKEVTPAEKVQVEEWLASDPQFRRLHNQQMKLRQHLVDLPVPTSQVSTDRLVADVLEKIDRRSQRRRWSWGGIAIVAALFGALGSSLTLNSPSVQGNLAANHMEKAGQPKAGEPKLASDEPLMLAMERPLIPMPKSANK